LKKEESILFQISNIVNNIKFYSTKTLIDVQASKNGRF